MKHTKYNITALIISGLFLFSCQQKTENVTAEFSGVTIAKPITYEVLVSNPNPDDEWKEECLANTNITQMVSDIIDALLRGDLSAYDYYDEHILTKSEVKQIVKESNLKEKTANIQFEEDWYWDKENLSLQKRVKKIMLGYELYNAKGEIRGYKASFVVNLAPEKN